MKKPSFVEIIAGWCFIFALIYIYVYKQAYLISNGLLLLLIVAVGIVAGFFFSLLEAALLSVGSREETSILEAGARNAERMASGAISDAEYVKNKRKYDRYLLIYATRSRHVPPLIMLSNLSNLFTASLVPISLYRNSAITPIQIDISAIQRLFQLSVNPVEISGGMPAFTFFSSAIFILILAKIAPKQIGTLPNRRAKIVMWNGRLILTFSWVLGWLGAAINAPIDLLLQERQSRQ